MRPQRASALIVRFSHALPCCEVNLVPRRVYVGRKAVVDHFYGQRDGQRKPVAERVAEANNFAISKTILEIKNVHLFPAIPHMLVVKACEDPGPT